MTGTSVSSWALTTLRPSRCCSSKKGRTTPSLNASSSPSRRTSCGTAEAAVTTSGKAAVTSLRSREYKTTRSPSLCSCPRMPSYLSSTHASPPTRRMIAAASSSGDASMNCSGCISRNRADRSSPRRASNATSPRSPVSMLAQDTSESGAPNAFAIPSSTKPPRSPMRRSPVRIFPMYFASRGVNLSSSSRSASVFFLTVRCS